MLPWLHTKTLNNTTQICPSEKEKVTAVELLSRAQATLLFILLIWPESFLVLVVGRDTNKVNSIFDERYLVEQFL